MVCVPAVRPLHRATELAGMTRMTAGTMLAVRRQIPRNGRRWLGTTRGWLARPEITQKDLGKRLHNVLVESGSTVQAIGFVCLAPCDSDAEDKAVTERGVADGGDWSPTTWSHSGRSLLARMGDAGPGLSSIGVECCAAAARGGGGWLPWLQDELPPRGVVVLSPEPDAWATAEQLLGPRQPNSDTWQMVSVNSAAPLSSGPTANECWPPAALADEIQSSTASLPLSKYHGTPVGNVERRLRVHALGVLHDLIVELERDALLYPFVNEPTGDQGGNSVLFFGHAVHHAELALLIAELLGLGWEAKKAAMQAQMGPVDLLLLRVRRSGNGEITLHTTGVSSVDTE